MTRCPLDTNTVSNFLRGRGQVEQFVIPWVPIIEIWYQPSGTSPVSLSETGPDPGTGRTGYWVRTESTAAMSAGEKGFSMTGQPLRARKRPADGPSVSPVTKAMRRARSGRWASSQS